MGRNMSIASGFPVLARMQDEKGLEMDFELMASFGETDHVTSFADSFLLKGFSSILQPSAKIGQSIFWHFLSAPGDRFLPYTAVKNTHPVPKLELDEVMCCRNFVGWTSAAEIWSGKPRGRQQCYQDISQEMWRTCRLIRDAYVFMR